MSCVASHRGNTADRAGRIARPDPRSREAGRVTAPDGEKFAAKLVTQTLLFGGDGLVTVGYAAYEEGAPAR